MSKKRSREIGWGMESILIWEQTQQIIELQKIASKSNTTTSSTTTAPSDIRLKYNIVFTGKMRGSLKEYTWDWNDTAINLNLKNYPTKGIIAQDALEFYPDAISIAEDGYLRVDYSKIPTE